MAAEQQPELEPLIIGGGVVTTHPDRCAACQGGCSCGYDSSCSLFNLCECPPSCRCPTCHRTEAYDTSVDKEGRPVPLHGKKSEREERWAALCTNGSLGSLLSLVDPFNMPAGARRPLLPSCHHTHSNSCPCCWLEPDNWSADEDMSAHLSAQLPLELDDCEGKWEPGDYLSADRLHTVEDERQTRRARAAARAAATLRAPAAQQQVLLAQQLQEMQGRQRPPHRRFSLFSSAPNLSDSLDLAPREDSAAAFGSEFAAPR